MSATSSPADAQHAMTASTEAPELPPRERLLMPSGPAFPEFVYRFLDKLFHLNMARQAGRESGVRGKTATIVVSVPAAGRLLATGRGVSTGRGKAGKAGNVRVKVTLTKVEQAFLKKHHGRRLRTKIDLRFIPRKGAKLTTSVTVLIA